MISDNRKRFESYMLETCGESLHDFTPWGSTTGHVAQEDDKFQYQDHQVNGRWLAWQARGAEVAELRAELEQATKERDELIQVACATGAAPNMRNLIDRIVTRNIVWETES